jgi:flagellar protein FlbD
MISVTKLDNTALVINADLIELVESIPETMICLTTGKKIMVREAVAEIVERVAAFKRRSVGVCAIRERESGEENG